jgi:hypothetical protein
MEKEYSPKWGMSTKMIYILDDEKRSGKKYHQLISRSFIKSIYAI